MMCTAKSSRTGKPCSAHAIRGGAVCRSHGGSAPQVIEAARRRLLSMVDPALSCLSTTLAKSADERLKWNAATDILDRAGLKGEKGASLQTGEARLTITYDAIQAIQQTDPERWRRIEAAAQAIMAEERGQDRAALARQAAPDASAGPG